MITSHEENLSQAEAKVAGEKIFHGGKPCRFGHSTGRYTSGGGCIGCIREKQGAARSSRAAHRAKLLAELKATTEKAEAERRQRSDFLKATAGQRQRQYRHENKEAIAEKSREYRRNNLHIGRASSAKRHARKLSATPGWFGEFDEFVMQEAAALCADRESATGFAWHVDHMIPLKAKTACGLHCAANLQVIPASMNIAKKNRMVATERDQWLGLIH